MTPHPGEAARLLSYCGIETSRMDRPKTAQLLVEQTRATCVLKGSGTQVATKDGESYTNTTGNPGMAAGGSGDVLTGIITGLLAQGMAPFEAAVSGVYLHGLAGDRAAENTGVRGMLSTDLLKELPGVLKEG